ncbi:MAG: hypothetical protein U0640_09705 [Phycisphaerales bacterium]
MHRPGCDPESMTEEDFLCDFCGCTWTSANPMVEGHKGSLICGRCLTAACKAVLVQNAGVVVPQHIGCAMCLLNKTGDYWQSPVRASVVEGENGAKGEVDIEPTPGSVICRWCIERSAAILSKDTESGWKRPQ